MERRRLRVPPFRPLVLIADGHGDTRELYGLALPLFGFEAITAEADTNLFESAWRTHPDVIVTEIVLPGQDYWQILDRLKRDPHTRDIPVVVVTSRAERAVCDRARIAGCAAVLIKPLPPDELARALHELLASPTVTNVSVPTRRNGCALS